MKECQRDEIMRQERMRVRCIQCFATVMPRGGGYYRERPPRVGRREVLVQDEMSAHHVAAQVQPCERCARVFSGHAEF